MANLFSELKRELGLDPNMGVEEAIEVLRDSGRHQTAWLEHIAANSRGKAKEWAKQALAGEAPPQE